ncbi:universal stress protein [Cytophagaceae bacterium ABcell3]|nr:universal stress protein [Cytophagaceae bacterium ABcell3]
MKNGIKVLFATDFSPCADNALKYGLDFVKKFQSEFLVVHAYKTFNIVTDVRDYDKVKDQKNKIAAETEQETSKACNIIHQEAPEAPCKSVALEGLPYKEICKAAKENDVDLVVLGAKNSNILERYLFGNTTAKVIENVQCPVLVVPQKSVFSPIKNIVYACNLSENEIQKINQLTVLAEAYDAQLSIVNIYTGEQENNKVIFEEFKEKTLRVVNYPKIEWLTAQGNNVIESLQHLVIDKHADLLVVSAHVPVFLENLYRNSVTEGILKKLTLPLLVFHLDTEDT